MRRRYDGWAAPVGELIEATDGWLRTPIYDVPTLPTWRRGRALLLGMSPARGQGASLALEDAWVLGKLVEERRASLEETMARFESQRRPRAEKLVAQGYENDRRSLQELGPVGQWMRDRVLMPTFASFIEKGLKEVYSEPLSV
jgi:2-polyprenyl-6-methoxyphenol hydroxylase-like FAD-dependent oxidoreductase